MKLYVGNLSWQTKDDELKKVFEKYGTVTNCSIIIDRETGRSKGFGFVEMSNQAEGEKAIEALNDFELGERSIKVNEARPREERPVRRSH